MKKIISILLAVICVATLLCSCQPAAPAQTASEDRLPANGFLSPVEFEGERVGTVPAIVSEATLNKHIDSPIIVTYNSIEEAFDALKKDEIKGLALPTVIANNYLTKEPDYATLPFAIYSKEVSAIALSDSKFQVPADAAITSIKNDGTANSIVLAHAGLPNPVDPYSRPGDYEKLDGRVITIGISNEDAYPFNYRDDDGNLIGINVDVAYEIAAGVKAELVIKEYAEDELIPALEAKEVDMIMSQFSLDEAMNVPVTHAYSHPYATSSASLIVAKKNIGSAPIITTM